MSPNVEREGFADALHEAAAVFEVPDTLRLHDAAVRRGRRLRRRRAGTAAAGGAVALAAAGALVFALPAGAGRGSAVVGGGTAKGATAEPGPTYPRPASAPAVRAGAITAGVIQQAVEYALPPGAVVTQTGGPLANQNVEVVDSRTHSWYAQTSITIKSTGQFGTVIALSVQHTAGPDTCAGLNQAETGGKGTCDQSTVAGGKLLEDFVPQGIFSSDGVFEVFEWFSPSGYETYAELQDSTPADFSLTKAQTAAMLTNQVFGAIAQALPADACVGGTFSKPVDPPSPGSSPLQHVRCSTTGDLFPSY